MMNGYYKNKDNGNVVKVIEGEAHGKVKVRKKYGDKDEVLWSVSKLKSEEWEKLTSYDR